MAKCNFETGHRPIDKIELLAREVLDVKHGNGEERRKNLGCLYCVVQARVNQLCAERIRNTEIKIHDSVNKPSHYQGKNGMEAIDVARNFIDKLNGMSAFYWGNAIKYLLRFQGKNGLEDLKKARKNLDWLIEEEEKKCTEQ